MKQLLAAILVAALAWSAYWWWGAAALEADAAAWQEARRDAGWQVEMSPPEVRGYPNRFDLTLTDITLVDPARGLGWEAPFFQLLRLSYRPSHMIAVWPDTQRFFSPGSALTLESDRMRASVVADGETLDRVTLVADVVNLIPDAGTSTALARAQLAARREGPNVYRLSLTAEGLVPPVGLVAIPRLPATLDAVSLDARLRFDAPWQTDVATGVPGLTQIDLTLAEAQWGEMQLRLTGTLDVDASGLLNGELGVQARDWQDMLAALRDTEALSPTMMTALEQGLTLLSRLGGNARTLDTTLEVQDGTLYAGPLPLVQLPRLN
ncbi:DUF2125 domain-containing protein [Pseudaestuariivita sp.]|uniref:DUF2125 domain-containing protein n=1 Tax=Pseudaestuariivita sp. TaxID=2211669 RepID=UPI004057FFBE